MAFPDFFIIGAPKAGTTALHAALDAHPQTFMSAIKEPKFFLCDEQPPRGGGGPGDAHSYREWVWRRSDYEALFEDAPAGALRGESTPLYLADLSSHERIHQAVPDAKLIVVLRDPVDRAYSNWTHLWSDGLEPIGDFLTACAEEQRRKEAGWAPFWRYVEQGLYGSQLEHLFRYFRRDQVYVIRYRIVVDHPEAALAGICDFLGIDTTIVREVPPRNVSTYVHPSAANRAIQNVLRVGAAVGQHLPPQVWRAISSPLLLALKRGQRNRPELSEEDREQLVGRFAEDIRLLERLTEQSFEDWLGHRVGGTYSVRKSWAPSGRVAS